MIRTGMYIVFGYLCGSILFARIFAALLQKGDITVQSKDGNPGTANAFVPVQLYLKGTGLDSCRMQLTFVILAPVLGHLFPVFNGFHGGKGIAVTFGCLLGLFPDLCPALILAFVFLFFSLVVRITPHYDRTIWTYRCAAVCMLLFVKNIYIIMAFLAIALVVNIHMRCGGGTKEKCHISG